MWIVKVALDRPYTFIVLALLILLLSPVVIMRTPTDIFPDINIPVVSIGWTYSGLNPEDLEGRLTSPYEKALTTLVDNIQHIESTTYNGPGRVWIRRTPRSPLLRNISCANYRLAFCRRRSSTFRPRACRSCSSEFPGKTCLSSN